MELNLWGFNKYGSRYVAYRRTKDWVYQVHYMITTYVQKSVLFTLKHIDIE